MKTDTNGLAVRLADFMNEHVLPAEAQLLQGAPSEAWGPAPEIWKLKRLAREVGLWNLFRLPQPDQPGLTHRQYAPLAELMGWSPHVAPEIFNCSAPDTGNMELLGRFGTPEQKQRWLEPLLEGDIRSCFSMTEPDVASSDATNIRTQIRDEGDQWVIRGRKWWTTGAMRPDCRVAMVMGVTDPEAAPSQRQSIILVPMDTPGLTLERSTTVFGYHDRQEGGHAIINYDDVTVPKDHLLGQRGAGFAVAQARLGPGRIHHCMRLIGMAERAIAHMVARATSRSTFGRSLAEHGMVHQQIAEARVSVDAARQLVLAAAEMMDEEGPKAARHAVAAAKVFVPRTVKRIIDDAIQLHGGLGLSGDVPLASLYAQARIIQIADGPDQVHLQSIAKAELTRTPALNIN
ncbi:acyl-CoA dehydrogenase family protein [Arthrobacter sp. BHU FT2]|nr:acyl-CoA dehydrogenase family protein [Arthrobacter sp. BHU FT2]